MMTKKRINYRFERAERERQQAQRRAQRDARREARRDTRAENDSSTGDSSIPAGTHIESAKS